MNKRGISPVIALVLLIMMGMVLAGIVYTGVKNSVVPKEEVIYCPEATDLIIRDVSCSTQNNLCLTLANKGKFSPDGYVLRADNRSPKSYGLYNLDENGSIVNPGEESFVNFSFPINYSRDNEEGFLSNLTYVEIQPYKIENGERFLCDTIISQEVICNDEPRDCAQTCEVDSDCGISDSCVQNFCGEDNYCQIKKTDCGEEVIGEAYCMDGNLYQDISSPICDPLSGCSTIETQVLNETCSYGCDEGSFECIRPTSETLDVMFVYGMEVAENKSFFENLKNLSNFIYSYDYTNIQIGSVAYGSYSSIHNYNDRGTQIWPYPTNLAGWNTYRNYWSIPPMRVRGETFSKEKNKVDRSFDYDLLRFIWSNTPQSVNLKEGLYATRNRFEVVAENHDRDDSISRDIAIVVAKDSPLVTIDFSISSQDIFSSTYCSNTNFECHRQYAAIEAQNLRDTGVEIYAIAVSEDETFNNFMREEIASSPDTYFRTSNFDDGLKDILIQIFKEKN